MAWLFMVVPTPVAWGALLPFACRAKVSVCGSPEIEPILWFLAFVVV